MSSARVFELKGAEGGVGERVQDSAGIRVGVGVGWGQTVRTSSLLDTL